MYSIETYRKSIAIVTGLKDQPLLALRLVLAYGFYGTAVMKWGRISMDYFIKRRIK
ncbi:MAG: hypothetical protein Q8M08_14020 [Bacteroidales bacterium]|nr:hypothetical protein [Bacteroidales bacterium]